MAKRTPHGEERHEDAGRPTSEATNDKAVSSEIYLDIESGYYVFVGPRGRTHVFTADGQHHTSFRTTLANRVSRVNDGKWERVERSEFPEQVK
jgi:hypothetical protein